MFKIQRVYCLLCTVKTHVSPYNDIYFFAAHTYIHNKNKKNYVLKETVYASVKGSSAIWAWDLSHPKRESYL